MLGIRSYKIGKGESEKNLLIPQIEEASAISKKLQESLKDKLEQRLSSNEGSLNRRREGSVAS